LVKKAASAVFDGSGGETPRSARRTFDRDRTV